jgi:hypothetical protein
LLKGKEAQPASEPEVKARRSATMRQRVAAE